jgi:4,5-dihydroxyphthalate decarboxylase
MGSAALSVAFWNYDRTLPLADGRVAVDGWDVRCQLLQPQELFPRAFGRAEFDVAELSLSRYAMQCAAGSSAYVAIPVFPSRTFRHASIYVRTDRGLSRPQDLKGRTVGLNNYDDTAAVVVRGMLRDDYGIRISDITWCIGDLESGQAPRVAQPALPAHIKTVVAKDRTLDAMLAEGTIDAVISIVPPPCFRAGHAQVARLFPDWRAAERDWYARTRHFPIMHLIGVRRSLLQENAGLARTLYDAFCRAKALAVTELENLQAPKATLPWAAAELAETRALLGGDFWPYGFAANRNALERQLGYSAEDGLLARRLAPENLFTPELLDT